MGTPPRRNRTARRVGMVAGAVLLAALLVYGLSRLTLPRVAHALISASPGWLVLALVLMMLSLLSRSASWHATLNAALPAQLLRWAPIVRATMIGVVASAVFPGRLGEPTRVVVLSRRLQGPATRTI